MITIFKNSIRIRFAPFIFSSSSNFQRSTTYRLQLLKFENEIFHGSNKKLNSFDDSVLRDSQQPFIFEFHPLCLCVLLCQDFLHLGAETKATRGRRETRKLRGAKPSSKVLDHGRRYRSVDKPTVQGFIVAAQILSSPPDKPTVASYTTRGIVRWSWHREAPPQGPLASVPVTCGQAGVPVSLDENYQATHGLADSWIPL